MCKTHCDCHKHWVIFINYYYNDILNYTSAIYYIPYVGQRKV